MTPQLEQRLRETYAPLFRKVRRAGCGVAPIEARGCECGGGWYDLLGTLCELLMWPYDQVRDYGDNSDPAKAFAAIERERKRLPALLQIKEKMGTLRVHFHAGDRRVRDLVGFEEQHSSKVCERCGAPGTLRTDGWMRVKCDACENRDRVKVVPLCET